MTLLARTIMIASATIKFAEGLVDPVLATNAFQIVLVPHKAMRSNSRLGSWLTWARPIATAARRPPTIRGSTTPATAR